MAIPFLLNALWALILAVVIAAGVVVLIRLEDLMLMKGLPGNAAAPGRPAIVSSQAYGSDLGLEEWV